MSKIATMMERVRRGAKILDEKYGLAWHDDVCKESLDVSSSDKCPLAQCFCTYDEGTRALNISNREAYMLGFHINPQGAFNESPKEAREWGLLTRCWQNLIAERLSEASRKASPHKRPTQAKSFRKPVNVLST